MFYMELTQSRPVTYLLSGNRVVILEPGSGRELPVPDYPGTRFSPSTVPPRKAVFCIPRCALASPLPGLWPCFRHVLHRGEILPWEN